MLCLHYNFQNGSENSTLDTESTSDVSQLMFPKQLGLQFGIAAFILFVYFTEKLIQKKIVERSQIFNWVFQCSVVTKYWDQVTEFSGSYITISWHDVL